MPMKSDPLIVECICRDYGAMAWLQYIADIAYDRDGYHNAADLGELVDELREFALSGIRGESCPIPFIRKELNAES